MAFYVDMTSGRIVEQSLAQQCHPDKISVLVNIYTVCANDGGHRLFWSNHEHRPIEHYLENMIDTVIIGAGVSGLCAAKTILQCDPNAEIRIFDAGSTIGGVWAKEKVYPTLKTNHYFGGLNFSDFPMPIAHGARPDDHMPGTAVHEFLVSYARHWKLEERIQLNTMVVEIRRLADEKGWQLKILTPDEETIECRKLIVSMGVNNNPARPRIERSEDFRAPLIHSADLGTHSRHVLDDPATKVVGVLGGGKSAYDAVHTACLAGKQVEWIMRKSGKGPVWVFPLKTKMGPIEAQRDRLPVRRIVSFFSPCIWNDGFRWIRKFLHKSIIGRYITTLFWAQVHAGTIQDCGYRRDEKLRVLEPEQSPFWYGTIAGACKYLPQLRGWIHGGQIRLHREDISHLSQRKIHLANGQQLRVDALITATGFSVKPTVNFLPASSHSELGLPSTQLTPEQHEFWAQLDRQSDRDIFARLPMLAEGPTPPQFQPSSQSQTHPHTPFRLYRSIAPPGPTSRGIHDLVFIGAFSNFANIARLELQCLWSYAYLNNKLALPSTTPSSTEPTRDHSVYAEASLTSRYARHRTPYGHGAHYSDHAFDQLPYFDTLMADLGLDRYRKIKAGKGWWSEVVEPYTVEDYRGVVGEWLDRSRKA